LGREFGIPAIYGDAEELLRREELDFVDIITDPWTHHKFVHMVAAHKVAVICQKPMAPTLAECRQMMKTCQDAGVPYFIHDNWRWQTPIRELKKVLDAGSIGTPFRARINFVSGFPVFINEPWLKDWPDYIMFDMGSHLLDTARFLFGEAQSVYCQYDRIHPDIKGEDVATVMLTMGGKTTVIVEMGFAENVLENDKNNETYFFIEGDKGSLELGPDYWLRETTKVGTRTRRCPPRSYRWADIDYLVSHSSIVPCNADFLQALQGKGPAETTGEDNLKSMILVFAAYDSARSGKTIHLTDPLAYEPAA
jgi:predicted dehydrogenase